MSLLNQAVIDTLPDEVYFDVLSTNFKSTSTEPAIFTFNESRSNPYIQSPEKYDLSILRFNVDTGTLPLFIPSIEPNQSDPKRTIYSVTLQGTSGNQDLTPIQKYIEWRPQDESVATPLAPSLRSSRVQDNTTGYYNCYSYNYFLFLIYRALVEATADCLDDYSNQSVALPSGYTADQIYSPLLVWDNNSRSAIFKAQQKVYDAVTTNRIKIFFNAPLFSLFNSFPASYRGYSELATFGRNFQLNIVDIGGSNTSVMFPDGPTTTGESWVSIDTYQEYSTASEWSPISAIVFTSNTLPIEPNQVSNPVSFVNGIPVVTGNNANQQNIITDIVDATGLYRPSLTYVPSAEYRRIHLYGNTPLHNLDINIFYRLRNGELVPFRLQSGGSVSLKIGFLKKV